MFNNKRIQQLERTVDRFTEALSAAEKFRETAMREIEQLKERIEQLDPSYQRAIYQKTTMEVSFMMDRFEELATKIMQREGASNRWKNEREKKSAEISAIKQALQEKAFQDEPAPAQLELVPDAPGILKPKRRVNGL